MTIEKELSTVRAQHFIALVLDNEVTVGEFVTEPPLPWIRMVQRDGLFQFGQDYPSSLTEHQARFEMKNWDEVSLPAIRRALPDLASRVDYLLFGNNAAQGLPLAQSVPKDVAGERAAIIYADNLPQIDVYRSIGYRTFFRRSQAVARMRDIAEKSGRPLALCFINTIQHNELNYHDP